MINSVVLVGRLGADPELRTTTSGKNVTSFRIAVNRRGSDEADWFHVSCWERTAEYVSNYLHKGRLVAVEGRLQSRKYTASDGSTREVVEVVANNVQSLDRPKDETPAVAGTPGAPPVDDPYDPFAQD